MKKAVKELTEIEIKKHIKRNCLMKGSINVFKCKKCDYKIPLATDIKTHYICGLMVQSVLNKEIEVNE